MLQRQAELSTNKHGLQRQADYPNAANQALTPFSHSRTILIYEMTD